MRLLLGAFALVDKDSHLYQTGQPHLWQGSTVRSNRNYFRLYSRPACPSPYGVRTWRWPSIGSALSRPYRRSELAEVDFRIEIGAKVVTMAAGVDVDRVHAVEIGVQCVAPVSIARRSNQFNSCNHSQPKASP